MSAPLVFMDTETTGLSLDDDIWEFAAVRRDPDGTETELHLLIEHTRDRCAKLPAPFYDDHCDRYLDHRAVSRDAAAKSIFHFFGGAAPDPRPHVIGAVPNFDTERVAQLVRRNTRGWVPGWHYHLIDVENLAVGYLNGLARFDGHVCEKGRKTYSAETAFLKDIAPPWDSNELSKAVGVDPERFDRHTAMGDARWAMAIYDAVMDGAA